MSIGVVQASSFVERLEQKMTLDELVRLTRPLTLATAKAVAAGNSGHQDDIIAAANMGRKAVSDLLRGCRVRVIWFITFCVRHRPREMYCGHAHLCVFVSVCLSVCPRLHAHTIARTRM